jgi:Crp-like helix-turn-helix domain
MQSNKLTLAALPEKKHAPWVQTERKAHEAWGRLVTSSPRAAALLHQLVAHMDESAAVVTTHSTLAKMCGCSPETIKRAIKDLQLGNWIQVVQIGGKGAALAFVINSRVAWATSRDMLHLAVFSARVIADRSDQNDVCLSTEKLRRIPVLHPGELQLPTGDGLPPPSQSSFDGLEPDLPQILQEDESNYRGSGFSKADLIMAAAYDDFPELFEKQKKVKK